MKRFYLLLILGISIGFCSCNPQRHLTGKAKRTHELSSKLGFKVSRQDDLQLYTEAAQWLKVPYRNGGNTKKGVDCSGLICQIYRQVYGIDLPRTTGGMAAKSRKVLKGDLKTGDLVFFRTSKTKKGISHVGLFLKKGYFIHASTSRGVIISNLKEPYYRKAWKHGGKIRK